MRAMRKVTRGKTTRRTVLTGSEFRKEMTPAEQVLWDALRGRQLAGLKFRRQHPFGSYILDFCCVEKRLVVEADGGVHLDPDQMKLDQARTELLKGEGLFVMR